MLAMLFMSGASVKELHFLFASHAKAHQDNCHNHLHSEEEEHAHCNVCNFDLSLASADFYCPEITHQTFTLSSFRPNVLSHLQGITPVGYNLRGPPAF